MTYSVCFFLLLSFFVPPLFLHRLIYLPLAFIAASLTFSRLFFSFSRLFLPASDFFLLADYPGYGKSSGAPSPQSITNVALEVRLLGE